MGLDRLAFNSINRNKEEFTVGNSYNAFMASYEAEYGTNASLFLRILGGDPDKIAREVKGRLDESNPLEGMFAIDTQSDQHLVHDAILREIKRIYFSKLSRESAVSVGNAVGELGSISLCTTIPELTFNYWEYANAWSKANPDQPPIEDMGCLL